MLIIFNCGFSMKVTCGFLSEKKLKKFSDLITFPGKKNDNLFHTIVQIQV